MVMPDSAAGMSHWKSTVLALSLGTSCGGTGKNPHRPSSAGGAGTIRKWQLSPSAAGITMIK